MKIVLIGATGFIGKRLFYHLKSNGHQLIVVSRNTEKAKKVFADHNAFADWNGKDGQKLASIIGQSDAVVNLAGASIAGGRWIKERKQLILSSRINTTRALVNVINSLKEKPEVLIQAGAIGYYGAHPEATFDETAPAGEGFLAEVSQNWEAATHGLAGGVRLVILRTGVVIDKSGGALRQMQTPFKLGAGGHIGTGKQLFSWIHLEDEVRAIAFLLENRNAAGAYNLTAPVPVTMKRFAKALGNTLRRHSWLHVPAFIIKLLLGQMGVETILSGQKVIPKKLLDEGFEFKHPEIEGALADIYQTGK
jgi:uncharacterized protein